MSDVVDAIVADLKTIRDRGELVAYLGSATRSSAGRCWPALTAVPRAGRDRVREGGWANVTEVFFVAY